MKETRREKKTASTLITRTQIEEEKEELAIADELTNSQTIQVNIVDERGTDERVLPES
jgi:hypothetical protein